VPQTPEGRTELLVPKSQMDEELADRIDQGRHLMDPASRGISDIRPLHAAFDTWDEYNEKLLARRFSTSEIVDGYSRAIIAGGFSDIGAELDYLVREVNEQARKLESIRLQLHLYESQVPAPKDTTTKSPTGGKVFIVHGHDGDTKQQVARFIEQIVGERPIILHEQVDSGRTVIEKFEAHADEIGFAVILLTGDDEGQKKGDGSLNLRARQNVVFEFGYFMAKLDRSRVVALHEASVELPSDLAGILYKSLAGNWMLELAGEIKAAGIKIDLAKALH
jgi:predicted nucleotide-binding protein